MAFTYSGDPGSSARDAVRFEIGDTDAADQQFSDAEIAYLLDRATSTLGAAADAASTLAARFARRADSETNGDLSASFAGQAERMMRVAAELRDRAADTTEAPVEFGLADPDAINESPQFWLGQFDSYRSTALDSRQP